MNLSGQFINITDQDLAPIKIDQVFFLELVQHRSHGLAGGAVQASNVLVGE